MRRLLYLVPMLLFALPVLFCWVDFGTADKSPEVVSAGKGWTPGAALSALFPKQVAQTTPNEITGVILNYASGPAYECDSTGCHPMTTETPGASPTATASATATIAPTWTQSATYTPPPTNTPRPTATAAIVPSATPTSTPEATQEITPGPTVTATAIPYDESCYAGVMSSSGLNVRSSPSITLAVIYGVLSPADRIPVYMIRSEGTEGDEDRTEWGMVEYDDKTAWIALWYGGVEYARLDDNAFCWELPIEYVSEKPAAEVVFQAVQMCLGWHAVTVDVDKNDMQASFVEWLRLGQCVAAKGMEEQHAPELALAFGGIGTVRYGRGPVQNGDCANMALSPELAALDMWARTQLAALTTAPPSGGYWLETDNECQGIYFEDLAWLDQYLAASIRLHSAVYPKVIFGTMLAGAWTQDYVNALPQTWEAALETGACLGIHAGSPLADYYAVDGLTIEWLWKYSFQHRDIRRWLVELDPRYVAIPFCVTEWASGGGWAPYAPQDYYTWANEVAHDGNLLFASVFTSGRWNGYGVNGRMAETARLWE